MVAEFGAEDRVRLQMQSSKIFEGRATPETFAGASTFTKRHNNHRKHPGFFPVLRTHLQLHVFFSSST
jgi:hypothetical protein